MSEARDELRRLLEWRQVKLTEGERKAIRDMLAENAEQAKQLADVTKNYCRVVRERDALAAFKAFVHRRLDEAGIPTHPEGPHSKEGCRIGDRLDIALAERKPGRSKLVYDKTTRTIVAVGENATLREQLEAARAAKESALDALRKEQDAFNAEVRELQDINAKLLRERDAALALVETLKSNRYRELLADACIERDAAVQAKGLEIKAAHDELRRLELRIADLVQARDIAAETAAVAVQRAERAVDVLREQLGPDCPADIVEAAKVAVDHYDVLAEERDAAVQAKERAEAACAAGDIAIRAANRMAQCVDKLVERRIIDSRSPLADARLDYSLPFTDVPVVGLGVALLEERDRMREADEMALDYFEMPAWEFDEKYKIKGSGEAHREMVRACVLTALRAALAQQPDQRKDGE